ncbi:universal stress protein [Thalassotalea atypica]|uniref:universal stress protein n=1 Tax=Thalassotalea atypica TaxID=2054316 RepID=UPI0025739EE0|nr:universal stress protein [Thalassotalea atypica]
MNKLLVIADFAEQDPTAIERAIELAPTYSASLHIVYFCYENLRAVSNDIVSIKNKVIETLKLNATAQLSKIDFKGVNYDVEVVWEKRIPAWVEDYSKKSNPSLVIKTGHRSETLFYTPTDWHLLRECPSPLLIVSEQKWRKARNVLAAIDLGATKETKQALNKKILAEAKSLAAHSNSQVHVCYTIPLSPLLRDLGLLYKDELENNAMREYRSEITRLAQQFDIPAENFHINAGHPGKVILSTAAQVKSGTVVIGVIGRTGITGRLIGNTSEQILELLKSDVLALKP